MCELEPSNFHLPSAQDFAVSTVPVCGGARLKNICSMGGPDTIIISNSDGAKKTLRVSVWETCLQSQCRCFRIVFLSSPISLQITF